MTYRVVIAEDEKLSALLLEKILSEVGDSVGAIDVICACHSGEETIAAVIKHQPDILFLDINMPQGDGFAVVSALEQSSMSQKPAIIFTTAHSRFAVRAFDVDAVDYLLKPLSNDRVIKAINKALKTQTAADEDQIIKVPTKDGAEFINTAIIDAMEASGDYIYIYIGERKLMLRGALRDYSEKLKSHFYQTHRSYLVNIDNIIAMKNHGNGSAVAMLGSGKEIPVSRRYRAGLVKLLPELL